MKTRIQSFMLTAVYAGVINMGIALSASAAFVISGGSTQNMPIRGNDFNTELSALNFNQMTADAQLSVNQSGFVDFYYIGAVSAFTNTFTAGDYWVTENNEAFNFNGYSGFTTTVAAGDILDFSFTSASKKALKPVDNFNNTNLHGLGIFFDDSQQDSLMQVLLGYDDQLFNDDNDHTDLLIRADFRLAVTSPAVSEVPVPAALYLFGSGLISLIGIALRKRKLV